MKRNIIDIYEGILGNVDDVLANGDKYVHDMDIKKFVNRLFNSNAEQRLSAITELKQMVELYKPTAIKQITKLSDYNGYIVEFSCNEPGKANNTTYDCVSMAYKTNKNAYANCYYLSIFGWETRKGVTMYSSDWKYIKGEFTPKRNLVYEAPAELTELFDAIYAERDSRLTGF